MQLVIAIFPKIKKVGLPKSYHLSQSIGQAAGLYHPFMMEMPEFVQTCYIYFQDVHFQFNCIQSQTRTLLSLQVTSLPKPQNSNRPPTKIVQLPGKCLYIEIARTFCKNFANVE